MTSVSSSIVDELGRIPMSLNLAASLTRASSYAQAQLHREVTLEHLLLALTEDPDAGQVLEASRIDLSRLNSDVSSHIGRVEDRNPPELAGNILVSPELRRILEAAAAAALKGRRREINGAIVLAAIVGEGRTVAAHMLRAQGLTFEEAIRVLQRAPAPAPPRPQVAQPPVPQPLPQPVPAPPVPPRGSTSAEDVLATARQRVQRNWVEPPPPSRQSESDTDPQSVSEPGPPPVEPSRATAVL